MTRGLFRLFLNSDPETQTTIVGDIVLVAAFAIVFALVDGVVQARVRRSLRR